MEQKKLKNCLAGFRTRGLTSGLTSDDCIGTAATAGGSPRCRLAIAPAPTDPRRPDPATVTDNITIASLNVRGLSNTNDRNVTFHQLVKK